MPSQPPDSTNDKLIFEERDGDSVTTHVLEDRSFHWLEAVDDAGDYHIAVRDWSSAPNQIDSCSRQWSDATASLLELP